MNVCNTNVKIRTHYHDNKSYYILDVNCLNCWKRVLKKQEESQNVCSYLNNALEYVAKIYRQFHIRRKTSFQLIFYTSWNITSKHIDLCPPLSLSFFVCVSSLRWWFQCTTNRSPIIIMQYYHENWISYHQCSYHNPYVSQKRLLIPADCVWEGNKQPQNYL